MVRLETLVLIFHELPVYAFTFQYGQIRNIFDYLLKMNYAEIYIPVWLDQKRGVMYTDVLKLNIYIPVWLDQKHIRVN